MGSSQLVASNIFEPFLPAGASGGAARVRRSRPCASAGRHGAGRKQRGRHLIAICPPPSSSKKKSATPPWRACSGRGVGVGGWGAGGGSWELGPGLGPGLGA